MSVLDHTSYRGKIKPLLKHLNCLQSPYQVCEPPPAIGEVAAAGEGVPGWEDIAGLPGVWQE